VLRKLHTCVDSTRAYNGVRWGGTLKKVFHFDSPRETYRCDAAVVWCFDNRFEAGFRKFLKRLGVLNPDSIKIAGGARNLATPDCESESEFVIDQIRKSIRLHQTQRVILMVHSDCGAYGGLEAFGGDRRAESQRLIGDLQRAAAFVRSRIPSLQVDAYFIDFEGVWDPEIEPVTKLARA
jgi:hypothetical protein